MIEAIIFTTSNLINFNIFTVEAVIISIALYALAFAELKWKIIPKAHNKFSPLGSTEESLHNRLMHLINVDKIYLSPDLTLAELAQRARTSPHNLSRFLNTRHHLNFNDFINKPRIEEAKNRLLDPEHKHKKISYLALECGFNSLSVFNPAFKKFTGTTPSQYQRHQSDRK
ncbi:helix-turn-helix transcriptional regulator [bacterium]|nr:helix-turn-helix transcriptional regulator [bacterium]